MTYRLMRCPAVVINSYVIVTLPAEETGAPQYLHIAYSQIYRQRDTRPRYAQCQHFTPQC